MATYSSPESARRNPAHADALPRLPELQSLFLDGESKENVGPKTLPAVPGKSSERLPEVPRSPMKAHTQNGNWSRTSNGYGERDEDRYYENDPGVVRNQDSPRIPIYTTQDKEHAQPHVAAIASADNPDLRAYSNGSSTHQAPRRGEDYMGEDNAEEMEPVPVPQLQYYHHSTEEPEPSTARIRGHNPQGSFSRYNDVGDVGQSIGRHLTPISQTARRTSQRPMSAFSDSGARRSPIGHSNSPSWNGRTPSAQSGRSNDGNGRPLSFMDLNNVSYPQMPPAPISFDNSQLRGIVGNHASLLSTQKTLEMYRQNIKKLNDPETQYAFAVFLVSASSEAAEQEAGTPQKKGGSRVSSGRGSPQVEKAPPTAYELLDEAKVLLQKLADRSYPFAQYYLADGYASGLFSKTKEADNATAFPLFVSASKHGHAEAGYRAALCYEFGWGCRRDPAKAVQFLRHAASKNHPGAMTRLGRACLSGDLGENKYREGVKWLKRATESADVQYNAAPYHLGQLYEKGCGDDIFLDEAYTAQLFTQAADLGHAEAAFRLGEAYEHGKLLCPRDPALSVHFYTGAAQKGHPSAMMALCAWYMIGAEPVLEKDENEAYEWAREAALKGTLLISNPLIKSKIQKLTNLFT